MLTLNRFFALHFLFAIIILVLAGLHVYFLHSLGSTSPEGRYAFVRGSFSYFYFYKDLQLFIVTMLALSSLALLSPNMLNHPDNFIEANPLVTPAHIVPE